MHNKATNSSDDDKTLDTQNNDEAFVRIFDCVVSILLSYFLVEFRRRARVVMIISIFEPAQS
jgi:hypothetical protein